MKVADLRLAYNIAYRKPQDLQVFTSDLMPKVFRLLERIEDHHDRKVHPSVIGSDAVSLTLECLR